MNLAAATPQQIDAELASLWATESKYRTNMVQAMRGCTPSIRTGFGYAPADSRQVEMQVIIAGYRAKVAQARADAAPYEAEFARRGGWNRYFLVTNSNGHVHRGMGCTTCYATTEYSWLVDLADCDEDAMVVEYGEAACTVCFPNAPTNPAFHAPGRRDREAAEARQAEKDAKAAATAAKAITAPGGGPLRVGHDVLRTKVAAQRKLSDTVQSFGWYGPTHPHNFAGAADQLVEALEAAGIDPQPIIARATKKAKAEGAEFTYQVGVAA